VHVKDACYPTDPDGLGRITPLGQGQLDLPAMLTRLAEIGYAGDLIIEPVTRGAEQPEELRRAAERIARALATVAER
jgi:sugar phosphate isomerase/epimerase